MMKLFASLLFLALFGIEAPQRPAATGSVEGRVVRADNDAPLSGARLGSNPLADPGSPNYLRVPEEFSSNSKVDGGFAYPSLAPGKYSLSAEADGYVRQSYWPFELGPGKNINNVAFRLVRAASVSGAIVSAGGPVEGIQVSLVQRVYDAGGRPALASAEAYMSAGPGLVRNTGSARTNDREEYRLYGVKPGRYYLVGA